jgi:hypothetical protein
MATENSVTQPTDASNTQFKNGLAYRNNTTGDAEFSAETSRNHKRTPTHAEQAATIHELEQELAEFRKGHNNTEPSQVHSNPTSTTVPTQVVHHESTQQIHPHPATASPIPPMSIKDVDSIRTQMKQGITIMTDALNLDSNATTRKQHEDNARNGLLGWDTALDAHQRLSQLDQDRAELLLRDHLNGLYTAITNATVINASNIEKILHFHSINISKYVTFDINSNRIQAAITEIRLQIARANDEDTADVFPTMIRSYNDTSSEDLEVYNSGERALSFIKSLPFSERRAYFTILSSALKTADKPNGPKMRQKLLQALQLVYRQDLLPTNHDIDTLIAANRNVFSAWNEAMEVWRAAAAATPPHKKNNNNNNKQTCNPYSLPQHQVHQQQAPPHGNGDPPHSMSTQHCDAHHYDYVNRCPHCAAKRTHCPACKLNSKFMHGPNNDSCLVCNASDTVLEKTLAGTRQVLRMAKAYRASHGVTGL